MDLPTRPEINYGEVRCARCNKACDFAETGGNRLFSKPDAIGNVQGYIYLQATCHGETRNVKMTFIEARGLKESGLKIVLFDEEKLIDDPSACVVGKTHEHALPERATGAPAT